jgi:hypothetical protein
VFNTVSRLIWDMDLIAQAAQAPSPVLADLVARVGGLLGDDRLGQQIFDDPVLRRISRVGQPTRHGVIGRADFFDLHKALRDGDVAAAWDILRARRPPPATAKRHAGRGGALDGRRLVLHLGLHKTASTWLQRQFLDQRAALDAQGVLVPLTGLPDAGFRAVRPGGFPGHQGLMSALRRGDEAPWAALGKEVAASGCDTVLISCENMALPTDAERDALLARLFVRLGGAAEVRVVAFVRSPDTWAEAYWAEQVCNGLRAGARTLPEFLVDHGDSLTDLPGLFAPFEAFAGAPVRLVDHDHAAATGTHWQAFGTAAGLGLGAVPLADSARARAYPGPDRHQIQAALGVNALIAAEGLRQRTLRAFFAALPPGDDRASFLPPQARLALVDAFAAKSAAWAAARGYAPDLDALRDRLRQEAWLPPDAVPAAVMDRLRMARLQAEHDPKEPRAAALPDLEPEPLAPARRDWADDGVVLRLRLRPWAQRALMRLRTWRGKGAD